MGSVGRSISLTRRQSIITIGIVWLGLLPPQAHSQQANPLIGFLSSRSPGESAAVVAAFRAGLAEAGFIEGRNVSIAFRWAEGNYQRLDALAAELVDQKASVVFAAGGPPSALAAKSVTTKSLIPVVFSAASDPVRLGLVKSLSNPGGNVTGMATLTTELASKVIQVLKESLPDVKAIGYLYNPSNPSGALVAKEAEEAGKAIGVQFHHMRASNEAELQQSFADIAKLGVQAIGVYGEPFLDSQRERIVALSSQYHIAGCYPWREYVTAGGLMSYGTSLPGSYRQAAVYVGRILKGEKPSDLPVMQPTKFELVINLKTAKDLGVTIPPTVLARADEIVD